MIKSKLNLIFFCVFITFKVINSLKMNHVSLLIKLLLFSQSGSAYKVYHSFLSTPT